ncbi:MAG TPA: protein kinase [Anaerolineaceae bacterium]|nr:protein kinase [Anaerolineaceae bacterium]HPN51802.1 protein kinase [Anaerolineaceae bacterium]
MAVLRLSFQDVNSRPLTALEISGDIRLKDMIGDILAALGLDPTANWQFFLVENMRKLEIRLDMTFEQAGARDGSIIQVQTGARQFGRYELRRKIGEGGMGVVWEGYDPNLGRKVAIKVVRDEYARDEDMMQRFTREARAVARLSGHGNVVSVFDFVYQAGQVPFFVMEFVDGESLDYRVGEGKKLSLEEICEVLKGVASALDAAHQKGIIHRDIKPSNILLQHDPHSPNKLVPKLVDFGLVRVSGESGATRTGIVVGSPPYMSPEQIQGEPLTRQSDIYSLGVVVYEMVAGQKPFQGASTKILVDHLNANPPPMRQFRDIPPQLEQVILKALAKRPENRYESAGEFAAAFEEALFGKAGKGGAKEASGFRIPPLAIWLVVGLIGLILLGVGGFLGFRALTGARAMAQAEKALKDKNYAEALTLYQQVLESQPQNPDALAGAGLSAEMLDNWPQASQYYQTWVNAAPEDKDALLKLGNAYLHTQEYDKSEAAFNKVAGLNNVADEDKNQAAEGAQKALIGQADNWIAKGNYEKAEEIYTGFLQRWPNDADGLKQLTKLYIQWNRINDAVGWAQNWVAASPTDVEALLTAGNVLEQTGDITGAIDYYRKVTVLDNKNGAAWKALWNTYGKAGEINGALDTALNWNKQLPDDAESQFALCDSYTSIRDWKKGEEQCQKYNLLKMDDARGWANLAYIYYSSNVDKNKIIDAAYRSLDINRTGNVRAYYVLTYTVLFEGNPDEALLLAQEWLQNCPDSGALAHAAMGTIYAYQKNYDSALLEFGASLGIQESLEAYYGLTSAYFSKWDWERTITSAQKWNTYWNKMYNDDYPIALAYAGWSYFNLGNYSQAVDYLSKAYASSKPNDEIRNDSTYIALGSSYLQLQQYEACVSIFNDWITAAPKRAAPYAYLADAYMNMKPQRCDLARRNAENALRLDPGNPMANNVMILCPK